MCYVSYFRGYRMLNVCGHQFHPCSAFISSISFLVWQLETPDCKSEILHVDLAKLQSKEFSVGLQLVSWS